MLERRVEVTNELGLHARAAAQLVRTSRRFSSSVTLTRADNGESANAKSILSLLYLAAAKGLVIIISVDGEDEIEALSAVEQLFVSGFGEM